MDLLGLTKLLCLDFNYERSLVIALTHKGNKNQGKINYRPGVAEKKGKIIKKKHKALKRNSCRRKCFAPMTITTAKSGRRWRPAVGWGQRGRKQRALAPCDNGVAFPFPLLMPLGSRREEAEAEQRRAPAAANGANEKLLFADQLAGQPTSILFQDFPSCSSRAFATCLCCFWRADLVAMAPASSVDIPR